MDSWAPGHQGRAQAGEETQGRGRTGNITLVLIGVTNGGDGVVVALKCSMTQIQLFYFATSAEAESRLDYREVLLICTER